MRPALAFQARELHASGIWSGRIADLLEVEERLVRRAIDGESFEEQPVEEPQPFSVSRPVERVARERPVERVDWPAPIDDATTWEYVTPRGSQDAVRVRCVRLWGKRVRIDALDRVWCHACRDFRTTDELSRVGNGCPVGLQRTAGVFDLDRDEAARHTHVRTEIDFMRVQW